MPLFYAHNINDNARLAIWLIKEDESFFRSDIRIENNISHPHKRLQHYAGRFLLKILEPAFPVNEIRIDGKRPYLPGNSFHFSISHCGDYAAAIVNKDQQAGIDVESASEKISLLKEKFLSDQEQHLLTKTGQRELNQLTLGWSAKEALFKWYQKGLVNFKSDMQLHNINAQKEKGTIDAFFGKEIEKKINVQYKFFDDLCLAWCMG